MAKFTIQQLHFATALIAALFVAPVSAQQAVIVPTDSAALAQRAPAEPTGATDSVEPSPAADEATEDAAAARLAQALHIVDMVLPAGAYRHSMEATFNAGQGLGAGNDDKQARREAHEERTGHALPDSPSATDGLLQGDGPMGRMMDAMETAMRGAMARVFARRYTTAQLAELEEFFSTPTGASYAANALTLMAEPEIREAMQQAMAEAMRSPSGQNIEDASRAAMKAATL